MRRARLLPAVLLTLVSVALIGIAVTERGPQERLKEVYTPSFPHVPPAPRVKDEVTHLWNDLKTPPGQAFMQRMLPSQGGALWLALIVALLVGFDFERLGNPLPTPVPDSSG